MKLTAKSKKAETSNCGKYTPLRLALSGVILWSTLKLQIENFIEEPYKFSQPEKLTADIGALRSIFRDKIYFQQTSIQTFIAYE